MGQRQFLFILAVLAICLTSALRDVGGEYFLKSSPEKVSIYYTYFIYLIAAMSSSLVPFLGNREERQSLKKIVNRESLKNIIYLNISSFLAFLFYFMAISKNMSAGIVSFVDYAMIPFFCACMSYFFFKEKLTPKFWLSMAGCALGVYILLMPRFSGTRMDFGTIFESTTILAFLSALMSGFTFVYIKKLLNQGFSKSFLLMVRFLFASVVGGIIVGIRGEFYSAQVTVIIFCLGVIGFYLPQLLTTTLIEKISIKYFSLCLFFIPVFTLYFSSYLGLDELRLSDFASGLVVFCFVAIYEVDFAKVYKLRSMTLLSYLRLPHQ